MFSKSCECAIKSTIYIAAQSNQNKRVGIKDIAKIIDTPEAFAAKILQQLVKNKIIISIKGSIRGFEIDKKRLEKIKLYEIVSAIDGDLFYNGCGLGLKTCSEAHPCSVNEKFKTIRSKLKEMLEKTTIHELALNTEDGLDFLKN